MPTITVPGILDGAEILSFELDPGPPRRVYVVRRIDAASPELMSACSNGTLVGDVTIVAGETIGCPDAVASAYQADGEDETVTFTYGALPVNTPDPQGG